MAVAPASMADKIIVLDGDDEEESPQASCSASTSSSQPQAKHVSQLKAQQPVPTHITQSPFASAKKDTHVLQAENQRLFAEVSFHIGVQTGVFIQSVWSVLVDVVRRCWNQVWTMSFLWYVAFWSFLFSPSSQFVEHCSALTQDCPEVLTYLQNKHTKASPDYLSSVEFRNTLGRCLTRAQANRSKTFVFINELCTVLKQHATKKRQIITKVEPGPCTSTSSSFHSTSVLLKSKDKTKAEMDDEEDGVNPAAEDKEPSTSGLQEDVKEEQEVGKKKKRASRKQVSIEQC